MPRKPRSDKGKPRPKPYNGGKKRKSPKPHRRRGSIIGLMTAEDKDALDLGRAWGPKEEKK